MHSTRKTPDSQWKPKHQHHDDGAYSFPNPSGRDVGTFAGRTFSNSADPFYRIR
jgi:hypothetical protein